MRAAPARRGQDGRAKTGARCATENRRGWDAHHSQTNARPAQGGDARSARWGAHQSQTNATLQATPRHEETRTGAVWGFGMVRCSYVRVEKTGAPMRDPSGARLEESGKAPVRRTHMPARPNRNPSYRIARGPTQDHRLGRADGKTMDRSGTGAWIRARTRHVPPTRHGRPSLEASRVRTLCACAMTPWPRL